MSIIETNGCVIKNKNPLKLNGLLKFSKVSIVGHISSQYISALLLSSVLQNSDVLIKVTSDTESASYVEITKNVMKLFGVEVTDLGKIYKVSKNSKFISPQRITVEGDWSNAAFFLVAGALSEKGIEVNGLDLNSVQGDKEILNILSRYGAEIKLDKGIFIKKNLQIPFEADIKNIPDLAPILAVLASSTKGVSTIKNINRLRLKESDRVKSIVDMINNIGAKAYVNNNNIIIEGKGFLDGGRVNSYNDHRIAMSACIASALCKGDIILENEQACEKSYPNFLRDFKFLGGEYVFYNREKY